MGRSAPAALFINVARNSLDADCLASAQMIDTGKGRVGRPGVTRPPHLRTKRIGI